MILEQLPFNERNEAFISHGLCRDRITRVALHLPGSPGVIYVFEVTPLSGNGQPLYRGTTVKESEELTEEKFVEYLGKCESSEIAYRYYFLSQREYYQDLKNLID